VIVLRQLVVGCPSSPLQTITDASGQGKTKALRYTVLTPLLLYRMDGGGRRRDQLHNVPLCMATVHCILSVN
jgi:hypothetical protein